MTSGRRLAKMRVGGRQLIDDARQPDRSDTDRRARPASGTDRRRCHSADRDSNAGPVAEDSRVQIESSGHLYAPSENASTPLSIPRRPGESLTICCSMRSSVTPRSVHRQCVDPAGSGRRCRRRRRCGRHRRAGPFAAGAPNDASAITESLLPRTVGVGLTLGRRLAEAMHGSLTVETAPGERLARYPAPAAGIGAPSA